MSSSPTVGLNTFVGSNAGRATTTGSRNAFFGSNAGRDNTASDNSFFGSSAGLSNTSGDRNAFFGISAGASNTAGCCNSFFGNKVGLSNTEGRSNAFFGGSAGRANTVGSFNSFFGALSGSGLSAGTDNTFVGYLSGRLVTTGTNNTFLGSNTTGASNLTNATAVGAHALVSSSNSLVLGGVKGVNGAAADTFVGIGTTSPAFPLDIKGANSDGNAAARIQSPVGTAILSLESTIGGTNQVWNLESGVFQVPGLFAIFDRTAFQARLAIDTTGNVGIGTIEPTSRLTVTGLIETSSPAGGVKFADGTIQTHGGQRRVGDGQRAAREQRRSTPDISLTGVVPVANGGTGLAAPGGAGNLLRSNGGAWTSAPLLATDVPNLDAGQITARHPRQRALGLIPTANIADSAVTAPKIAAGQVVKTLNGLTDSVSLAAGPNVTITPAGNTLTIAASGGGGAGILNQTALQAGANFNIDGTGTADVFNAATQYNLGGNRVLSVTGSFTNTFAGVNAGAATTTNFGNTFFGNDAGAHNVDGGINSFFGRRAGYRNRASGNAFFGSDAGLENSSGIRNSYFGTAAGKCNPEGSNNSFFGYDSGASCTTNGSGNSFFGAATGLSYQGNDNSFFGWEAGRLTMASGNTFVGAKAGDANSTGSNNTVVGANADVGSSNLTNATALGANAQVTQSDSLVLGNNASVGVGTSAPRARLDVQGGDVYVGSPGQGIILRSPDGASCARITIDNGGALVTTVAACP